jgi:ribonuclease BN (tRNA processing enzyme)
MIITPLKGKVSLTNKGHLSLFFLGCGSAFTKRLYQNNLLIIKGEDHLLIDCGSKCTQSMYEVGIIPTDIRNILITHSHADHIGGLEEIALFGRYVTKRKPTMVISEAYQHILWDMSLRGGCAHNEEVHGDVLSFKDMFNVIRPSALSAFKRETQEVNIGSINIKIFRTKHIPDSSDNWENSFWSCGLIIDNRIMFTSDTRFDEDLLTQYDQIFNFETIFHDCQFFTGGVHASLDEISALPVSLKKRMALMHYGDDWEKYEDRIKKEQFYGLVRQHQFYDFENKAC